MASQRQTTPQQQLRYSSTRRFKRLAEPLKRSDTENDEERKPYRYLPPQCRWLEPAPGGALPARLCIVQVLIRLHHRAAQAKWRRHLPRLVVALRRMRDFYMEISYFREKVSWRYPKVQKNFKFFHKMKEFQMLIFKLMKIPY